MQDLKDKCYRTEICAKNTKTNKDSSSESRIDCVCPASGPARSMMALRYSGVTVIMELEYSLAETDRAWSRGMVSMAMASASE